jgi:hypothetical protein
MHPFMALWIWSMTMSRVTRDAIMQASFPLGDAADTMLLPSRAPIVVHAGDYMQSEVTRGPLPGAILDKLADLYWTERDSELAI